MKKGLIVLLLLVAACTYVEKPAYQLLFSVQETGKSVDGNVYINGNFIGRTRDGGLGVLLSNMSEGSLNFAGYYQGRPFNYSYSISTDNLNSRKLSFSVEQSTLESFAMIFLINGSKEQLEGTVSLNDIELGNTNNGKIIVPFKDIREGKIAIIGAYRGKPFEFKFLLSESDIKNAAMTFVVSPDDLDNELFDASEIDRFMIEQEIVKLVNVERKKLGTTALKWNSKAADVAYSHSLDMATRDYFAHASPEGFNVGERLKKTSVFYSIAAEDLSFFDNVRPDTNISKKSVEGWMNSPGHRAPIVDSDGLFSDAGAGVACVQKTCYVTLVFVGNERSIDATLPPGYLSFYYLYDPNFGFDIPVPLRLTVKSTSPVSVYVVSGRNQYDQLLKGQGTDYLEK
ncbi:MAG: CAP domain-containing protein, partial [Nanoarchaeota archaeon]